GPELPAARAEPRAGRGGRLARRTDARAPERRGGRAQRRLQHDVHEEDARGDRRLRCGVRRRGRRRRPLLAAPEQGLCDRLQPGVHRLALPPEHREGVPEAADGLRQGGGAPLLQASLSLQPARTVTLARPHLRRAHDGRALPPARHLLRRLRARALPVALRAALVAPRLPAVHARVERGRRAPLPLGARLAAHARHRGPAARRVGRAGDGGRRASARRPALRGPGVARPDRAPHLPRAAGQGCAALPLAAAAARAGVAAFSPRLRPRRRGRAPLPGAGGHGRRGGARSRQPRRDRRRERPPRADPERCPRHRGGAHCAPPARRGARRAAGARRLSTGLLMGSTVRLVRKILGRLVPYRWLCASALVQVLLIGVFELAKPWPLKVIVDDVLGGRPLGWPGLGTLGGPALLALACLALVAIYGLLGVLSVTSNYATIKVGQQMVNDFRSELYAHLQRLSLAFHSRRQVG